MTVTGSMISTGVVQTVDKTMSAVMAFYRASLRYAMTALPTLVVTATKTVARPEVATR